MVILIPTALKLKLIMQIILQGNTCIHIYLILKIISQYSLSVQRSTCALIVIIVYYNQQPLLTSLHDHYLSLLLLMLTSASSESPHRTTYSDISTG